QRGRRRAGGGAARGRAALRRRARRARARLRGARGGVPAGSELGRTGGVLNRIEVDAVPVGTVAFSGPGAGGDATSSAVLGDLVAIARGQGSTWAGLPPATAAR
ncbi:MAG: hypothetical protein ACJ758_01230, partial [Actinomycetota bacterium]